MTAATVSARGCWWVLAAATCAASILLLDETSVSTALGEIQRDLGLDAVGRQWVIDAYLVAFAALVALGGRLGDSLGHRQVFVAGMAAYLVASVFAGFATSGTWLIAARATQGAAAGFATPTSLVMINNAFARDRRGRALGLSMGISALFLLIGPVVGGALTQTVGWRWVMWIAVPLSAAALAAAFVRADWQRPKSRERIDAAGAVLLIGALGLVVTAIMQSTNWGWTSAWTLAMLAGGVACAAMFFVVEKRMPNPLVDPSLIRRPAFVSACGVGFGMRFTLMSALVFLVLYMLLVLSWSPLMAGIGILAAAAPAVPAAPLAGWWADRRGTREPILVGLCITLGSMLLLFFTVANKEYWQLVPGLFAFGAGATIAFTPTTVTAMVALPPDRVGTATGVLQTARQSGGAVGLAVLTAAVVGVQRADIARHGLDFTGQESDAIMRGTMPAESTRTTDVIVDAFVSGIRAGIVVLAAVIFACIVIAFFGIRNKPAYGDGRPEADTAADGDRSDQDASIEAGA